MTDPLIIECRQLAEWFLNGGKHQCPTSGLLLRLGEHGFWQFGYFTKDKDRGMCLLFIAEALERKDLRV